MTAAADTELAAIAATEASALALPTLNPEAYAAAIYAPFHAKLDAAIIEADAEPMPDCSTTAGMALAVKRRAFFRDDVRIAVEDARAERKAPILEIGRKIDGKAKEIALKAAPYESRYHEAIKAEEARKEAEKAAKIAAERARVEAIQKDIDNFRRIPQLLIGKSVADLAFALKDMRAMLVTEERFEEFTGDAENVVADVTAAIESMHAKAVEAEAAALAAEEARKAEADRLEAERAELAKLRAEQIERERIAKVESDRIAAEQAAEAKRLADMKSAQEAEQRRIAEQAAANLRQERDAQELAMRLEREAAAEVQRKANEELKAAQAELAASQAAHAAAIAKQQADAQREADHTEALADNATFDAAMQRLAAVEVPTFSADLARCNAMVGDLLADARNPTLEDDDPRVIKSLVAFADAFPDCPELTNEDIIEFGAEMGLPLAELVMRLEAFTVYARAELLV